MYDGPKTLGSGKDSEVEGKMGPCVPFQVSKCSEAEMLKIKERDGGLIHIHRHGHCVGY